MFSSGNDLSQDLRINITVTVYKGRLLFVLWEAFREYSGKIVNITSSHPHIFILRAALLLMKTSVYF